MKEIIVPNKLSVIPKYYTDFLRFANQLVNIHNTDILIEFPNEFWTYPIGFVFLSQFASDLKKKNHQLLCRNMPDYIKSTREGDLSTILDIKKISKRTEIEIASEDIVKFISQKIDLSSYIFEYLVQDILMK